MPNNSRRDVSLKLGNGWKVTKPGESRPTATARTQGAAERVAKTCPPPLAEGRSTGQKRLRDGAENAPSRTSSIAPAALVALENPRSGLG